MSNNTPTQKVPVVVTLETNKIHETMEGFLFMKENERLVDLLNDDREFLPFESNEFGFYVISKSSISKVKIRREGSASRLTKG